MMMNTNLTRLLLLLLGRFFLSFLSTPFFLELFTFKVNKVMQPFNGSL